MTSPKASKKRIALIGAGYIAEYHLGPLRELDHVEVAAVVDPSRAAREALCRNWGIPASYPDLGALFANEKIDAAHVLAPPPFHEELAEALVERGIPSLIEKPLGIDEERCEALVERALNQEVPLGVNQSQALHPDFLRLKERIDRGEIGKVEHVIACSNVPLRQLAMRQFDHWMFQHPKNILLEAGTHPFSLIHALVGPVIEGQAQASDRVLLAGELPFLKTWNGSFVCERGTATASLGFGKSYLEVWLHVIGSDGSLHVDLVHGLLQYMERTRWPDFYDTLRNAKRNAKLLSKAGSRSFWNYVKSLARIKKRSDPFYASMRGGIHAFHEALWDHRKLPVTARDGLEILRFATRTWDCCNEPEPDPQRSYDARTREIEYRSGNGEEVLVLGASGFIGGHLVQKLLDEGYRVRILLRRKGYLLPWLDDPGVLVFHGSLSDETTLREAMQGCKAVFHLATAMGETWSETRTICLEGTKRLAELSLELGVGRFVYTSSIAAVYLGDKDGRVTESRGTDPDPTVRNLYARAKIACEALLEDLHQRSGLPVVIFRPALVVGERGRVRHSGAGFWASESDCLGWGPGDTPLPFVLVEDVCAALVESIRADAAVGEAFNLAGDLRPTAREYTDELAKRMGRRVRFHAQRLFVMQSIEFFKWLVKVAVRKPGTEFPSYRDLKTRALRPWIDCSKAKQILDWRPESDLAQFYEKAIDACLDEAP